ncbi:MAG: hypothetical protein B7Z66_03430 [Chromatiales bacterium 21-64-14]|nr:MAG: hypothetical protein B7Z66_03430 [Chromatiales bacterium 21-64-14]HQU15809.1 hypothetical protein [Gammaproteobacteria bacterium]
MPNLLRLFFLVLLPWVAAGAVQAAPAGVHERRLEDAIRRNQSDVADAVGQRYENTVIRQYQATYPATLHACIKSQPAADLSAFDVALVIGRDGAVTQVLVWPVTGVASCLRERLLHEHFQRPPFAPFHSHIHMTFSP